MLKTLEAVIDEQGNVRLTEPADVPAGRRALVIILNESAIDAAETALLGEQALAEDWSRPEEDEAWLHLQQLASS